MKDKISALMDGELDSIDVADTISQIKESEELRNEWSTYHLIGDILRQPAMSTPDIALRIRNEVDIESIVLTPDIPKERKEPGFCICNCRINGSSCGCSNMDGWADNKPSPY